MTSSSSVVSSFGSVAFAVEDKGGATACGGIIALEFIEPLSFDQSIGRSASVSDAVSDELSDSVVESLAVTCILYFTRLLRSCNGTHNLGSLYLTGLGCPLDAFNQSA